jgi:hypothetical protein
MENTGMVKPKVAAWWFDFVFYTSSLGSRMSIEHFRCKTKLGVFSTRKKQVIFTSLWQKILLKPLKTC